MKKRRGHRHVFAMLLYLLPFFALTQPVEERLFYPEWVDRFYQEKPGLFWFSQRDSVQQMRRVLVGALDTAFANRFAASQYHHDRLLQTTDGLPNDSLALMEADRLYTDAALALSHDLYKGLPLKPALMYDVLTKAYADSTARFLLNGLLRVKYPDQLHVFLQSLSPADPAYALLYREWKHQLAQKNTAKIRSLEMTLNAYRWIHHFRFEKFILINLAEARLYYWEKDSLVLQMKTVVGKPATPTPRFATWCPELILYPYWYVPASIVFNEYLPLIRSNPGWLDANNMQVIDGNGRVLDPRKLDWAVLGPGHFPYQLRQSTGCDNALGVMKFNIQTPFGVYLHDTNRKTAFMSGYRYYSHGCIRLADPQALGNRLLDNRLDTNFLRSCFREQKPVTLPLRKPIPVLSLYIPVTVEAGGKLKYQKDVYRLLN